MTHDNLHHHFLKTLRKEEVLGRRVAGRMDVGVRHSDAHKIAEELRMEGKGSKDPAYDNQNKNK
jgi:hypothetical protein